MYRSSLNGKSTVKGAGSQRSRLQHAVHGPIGCPLGTSLGLFFRLTPAGNIPVNMLVEMSGSSDKTSGHVRRQGLRPLPLQGQLFIDGSTGSLRRVGRSSLLGILLTIIVALVNCYERDERIVLVPA